MRVQSRWLLAAITVLTLVPALFASPASADEWCTGKPNHNLTKAKQSFRDRCGEQWNSQRHVCDYKDDGFHCNGTVSGQSSGGGGNDSGNNGNNGNNPGSSGPVWCTGTPDRNINRAKQAFADRCGERWNGQRQHVCEWKSDGWHCSGTVGASATQGPPTPRYASFVRLHPRATQITWQGSGSARRFEVYFNNRRLTTTSSNSYIHRGSRSNYDRYEIVAIDSRGQKSPAVPAGHNAWIPGGSNVTPRQGPGVTTRSDRVIARTNGNYNTNRGSRRVEVTFTATREGRVTGSGSVTNERGQTVGTVSVSFDDQGRQVSTLNPTHGNSFTHTAGTGQSGRPVISVLPDINAATVVNGFPSRRPQTTNPGDGDPPPKPDEPRCGEGSHDAAQASGSC